MQGRGVADSWTVLVLGLHQPDGRRLPVFNPDPPRNPQISPRYACGGCSHLMIAGIPLVELKQRAMRPDMLIRCPACKALNSTQVITTRQAPAGPPDRPEAPSSPWHVSRALKRR